MTRQLNRIARLLGVDVTEVQGLDAVPDADLATLHDQVSEALYGDARGGHQRIAALAEKVPAPVAGRMAERFVPPTIAARIAEVMAPARARDLVTRVRVPYLAEIAVALDPVQSRPVVEVLPAKRIGEVARELYGRGEYVVMAEFVDAVSQDALEAAFEVASPHDLLAITPLLEWTARVEHLVATLPDDKVRAIVDELSPDELAALSHVLVAGGQHASVARFADLVPAATLDRVLQAEDADDLRAVRDHVSADVAARIDEALARR